MEGDCIFVEGLAEGARWLIVCKGEKIGKFWKRVRDRWMLKCWAGVDAGVDLGSLQKAGTGWHFISIRFYIHSCQDAT